MKSIKPKLTLLGLILISSTNFSFLNQRSKKEAPKIMKDQIQRTGRMVLLFSLVLLFNSCFMEDNNGFPKHVTFDAGGSTQIITGEISPGGISLFDGSQIKGYLNWENDEVQYGWLKVRFIYSKHQIVLTASHNESKQKRSYRLYLGFAQEYGNIIVTQKGK